MLYVQDHRDCQLSAAPPPPPGEGALEVRAYANGRIGRVEVRALVEVAGVGSYWTPFKISVPAGRYALRARYWGQVRAEEVEVGPGEEVRVELEFAAPIAHLWAAQAAFGLALMLPQLIEKL